MSGRALITGGAGFIGTNLAFRLLADGQDVIVFDNISRAGVDANLARLRAARHRGLRIVTADVRDAQAIRGALDGVTDVFHFAAQVAVTHSLDHPLEDFDINARGTLVLLEALRETQAPARLFFTSTNKVYGNLEDVGLTRTATRYEPLDARVRAAGVSEERPLAFHSPYGCSKGAADQYVLDYARTYGLPAVVFRMSCIYGPHQCGTEDQGWVAHFLVRALNGEPVTIYGDGAQVRDILFVDDLLDAFLAARARMTQVTGQAFNIGGGPERTTSLLELMARLSSLLGREHAGEYAPWRAADQRYYVSDCRRFSRLTGWKPTVGVDEGLSRLLAWLEAHRPMAAPLRRTATV